MWLGRRARTGKYLGKLIAVPRLREVRALRGFSRIEAPEMDPTMELFGDVAALSVETAPLSAKALDWLPAVENFGEGFFVCLEPERLERWEKREGVRRSRPAIRRAKNGVSGPSRFGAMVNSGLAGPNSGLGGSLTLTPSRRPWQPERTAAFHPPASAPQARPRWIPGNALA